VSLGVTLITQLWFASSLWLRSEACMKCSLLTCTFRLLSARSLVLRCQSFGAWRLLPFAFCRLFERNYVAIQIAPYGYCRAQSTCMRSSNHDNWGRAWRAGHTETTMVHMCFLRHFSTLKPWRSRSCLLWPRTGSTFAHTEHGALQQHEPKRQSSVEHPPSICFLKCRKQCIVGCRESECRSRPWGVGCFAQALQKVLGILWTKSIDALNRGAWSCLLQGCANYSFHGTNVINYPVTLPIGK